MIAGMDKTFIQFCGTEFFVQSFQFQLINVNVQAFREFVFKGCVQKTDIQKVIFQ